MVNCVKLSDIALAPEKISEKWLVNNSPLTAPQAGHCKTNKEKNHGNTIYIFTKYRSFTKFTDFTELL